MKIPKKKSENIVADNGYRKSLERIYDLGDGKEGNFLIASHYGKKEATCIIPITSDGKILYLKEFRYGPERVVICFPMGAVEENETEGENAKKELQEETGYSSNSFEFIGETIVANYEKSISRFYLAKDCIQHGNQKLEKGELIEIYKTSIDNFEKMILNGEIQCPLTISGFYLAKYKI